MDPLKTIEDRKAQIDMGIMAARVFLGAVEETNGDLNTAFLATYAFFRGMFAGNNDSMEGGEDKSQ